MKIALCVKQVPDTSDIKWTENNTMQREGVESIINPYDIYAIEAALKFKKNYNAEVTVFTMGPLQAVDMLKNIIALGIDRGVVISDRKFAGADTYATGITLSAAIKKELPDFDIILCGQFAIDGDTGQTGPCIANLLNIPQLTFIKDISEYNENSITASRFLDDGIELVKVKCPALLCMLKSDFEPSRALINGIIKAQNSDIKILTFEDLGLNPEDVGLKGSPTYVSKAFRPDIKHSGEKHYCLENNSGAQIIYDKMKEIGVFNG